MEQDREQSGPASFDGDRPIPPLRRDINIVPFSDNGESLVILHDRYGYAEEPMVVPASVMPILELADGTRSVRDIAAVLNGATGGTVPTEQIAQFFATVDRAGFLDSGGLRARRERIEQDFVSADHREAACAGSSYAADAAELTRFLDKVMQSAAGLDVETNASAVVVPHIDLRVGAECYAPAYRALQGSDADVFVVFGTSHYGWQDLFILTEKHFRTPLGVVQTDVGLVRSIRSTVPFDLTTIDIAHKDEHSIEFQILFLQHLFGHRPFTVLPVLVTSFQPFIDHELLPSQSERFQAFITALRTAVASSGKKAAFIASADMAHIGKKFGDEFAAGPVLPVLAAEDTALLNRAAAVDTRGFFTGIASVNDHRRICGLPPIYSMLEAARPNRGRLLDYRQWDERETESAVTFASIAYYTE